MLSMLSLFTALVLAQPQEWTWSVFPMAGFKILSPVTLMHDLTEVPTATDKIEYHQFHGGSLADTSMGMAFIIDHYIFPAQDQEPDPEYLRDFFENTIDEILTSVEGSLVYMDFIRQPGQDVCIWKATSRNGEVVIRGHCILSGDAYYGLQVFGWKKDQPDEVMSKFLESFKRIDNDSILKK
jgi:hypothetical protein